MGQTTSQLFEPHYTPEFKLLQQHPEYSRWSRKFESLLLTSSNIQLLHKCFYYADVDHSGSIDVVELITVLGLDYTKFTERVFSIFDSNKNKKIDFCEYVLSLWNYCTLSRTTLGVFAFDLYDRDRTGILEQDDIDRMVKDIYGNTALGTLHGKQ